MPGLVRQMENTIDNWRKRALEAEAEIKHLLGALKQTQTQWAEDIARQNEWRTRTRDTLTELRVANDKNERLQEECDEWKQEVEALKWAARQ